MRRRLLFLLYALALVACLGIAAMWVRSYTTSDRWPLYLKGNGTTVHSWWGRVLVVTYHQEEPPERNLVVKVGTPDVGDRVASDHSVAYSLFLHRLHEQDVHYVLRMPPRLSVDAASWRNGFGFGTAATWAGRRGMGENFTVVSCLSLPYWTLWVAASLPLAQAVYVRRVTRRRKARGMCPRCGYDLRATPAQCPECGAAAGTVA